MGGECRLVQSSGEVIHGPQCTNNFQIKPFSFRGYTFYSCEQAYQAFKFNEGTKGFNSIMNLKPDDDSIQGATNHGNDVWWHGQQYNEDCNKDWKIIKVRVMLDVNRAKYSQHSDLCKELLSTGSLTIVGGPSTTWLHKRSAQTWSSWNGRIQMIIREELRSDSDRNQELLDNLLQEIICYETV